MRGVVVFMACCYVRPRRRPMLLHARSEEVTRSMGLFYEDHFERHSPWFDGRQTTRYCVRVHLNDAKLSSLQEVKKNLKKFEKI